MFWQRGGTRLRLSSERAHWTQAKRIQQARPISTEDSRTRHLAVLMAVLLAVFASQAGAIVPGAKAASKPKAVVIVGPTGSTTSHFLDDGKIIANQAEDAGMNVIRIFHPHATWQ